MQTSLLSTKVVSGCLSLSQAWTRQEHVNDLQSHNVTISLSVRQVEMSGFIRLWMNLAHCGELIHHLNLAVPEDPSGSVAESTLQR